MQGRLTKFLILFYCLLDGGQFTVSRGGARLKGSTFGCCLSAFPHKTAETRGNQHHSGEEGAMADTIQVKIKDIDVVINEGLC